VKRGLLVVFEGLDGSGKSTQLARLAEALEAGGHAVVRTREPHDCPSGRRIRAMARSGEGVAPAEELAWFLEQRRDHVRDVIAPALAAGRVVLCDRYFLSTVAYQGARGLDPARILRESESKFPLPDLVLLLEIEPAAGLARVAGRGGTAEPAFEGEAFLTRVAREFRALDLPYLVRIDARGTPDAVAGRVAAAVGRRLPELRYGPPQAPARKESP
jgi:dTMP kinase